MLVVFGHAPNTASSNCSGLVQNAVSNMPTLYAIGTGLEYQNGVTMSHFVANPTPVVDVSSKLGAPLKQTSTPKHNLNQLSFSGSNRSSRVQPTAYNTRYKTQRCHSYSETGYCNYKEKCQFAHGDAELRQIPRHPKRKTEPCRNFHTTGVCNYGERCDFIHNEQPTQLQSPTSQWPSTVTNGLISTTMTPWTSPPNVTVVSGSSSATSRRTASTTVAPLTIPGLAEPIGLPVGTYFYPTSTYSAMGSVCSSDQSCTSGIDSPPPSSSGCGRSPVSFSPDLGTNGSYSSFDNYVFSTPPQQQSPMTTTQAQTCINTGDDDSAKILPDFGTAAAARRVCTFSTDSGAISDGSSDERSDTMELFSLNPHQPNDLDQIMANLCRLNVCRLDSLGGNDGYNNAEYEMGPDRDQQPISKSCQQSMGADRRLPTFTWLTQGDAQAETGDETIGSSWVSTNRKCVF